MHRPSDTPTSPAAAARRSALAMDPATFRAIGHRLVDDLAEQLASVAERRVTPGESPAAVREGLRLGGPLPERGEDPVALLARVTRGLFNHSLFNGHPRFLGYITSSPAPIGMFGDLLGAAANPNVGSWTLGPAATEIELEAIRWIAGFIGYPESCGGVMVSGGNMANFVGFLAARAAKCPWDVRANGVAAGPRLRAYVSAETHTWIQKAADLFGHGTDAVRWIACDEHLRMDVGELRKAVAADRAAGDVPFLVVGTAGSVSTGAVDPLPALAAFCREEQLWFHVDGAYGGFAAALADAPADLHGLAEADSVAVDPHKWLYAPLEAGCALVRDPAALRGAFAYHPPYYHFDEEVVNFVDHGLQNSRGFRALKVWLALKQAGAAGYRESIAEDVRLTGRLAEALRAHGGFEVLTESLSIVTFRYVPASLRAHVSRADVAEALDALNRELLDSSQRAGAVFVSNAVVRGRYALRSCIVNFHTSEHDVAEIPAILAREGAAIAARMQAAGTLPPG